MAIGRELRNQFLWGCHQGVMGEVVKIVWEEPSIVRDTCCEPLIKGRNATFTQVLRTIRGRLGETGPHEMIAMDASRPGWLHGMAQIGGLRTTTLAKLLVIGVGDCGRPQDLALCRNVLMNIGRREIGADQWQLLRPLFQRLQNSNAAFDEPTRSVIDRIVSTQDN